MGVKMMFTMNVITVSGVRGVGVIVFDKTAYTSTGLQVQACDWIAISWYRRLH